MDKIKHTLASALSMFFCYIYDTQIIINEISNKNTIQIPDENNEFEDWIELYNSSPTSVNLRDYYLSDDSLHL